MFSDVSKRFSFLCCSVFRQNKSFSFLCSCVLSLTCAMVTPALSKSFSFLCSCVLWQNGYTALIRAIVFNQPEVAKYLCTSRPVLKSIPDNVSKFVMFVFHQGGLSVGCILVVFDWDGLSQGWSFIMPSSTTVLLFFWLCALSEIFDFTIVLQCNRYPLHYACALPTGQDKVFVRILLERNPELIEKKMDKVSILLQCLFSLSFFPLLKHQPYLYTLFVNRFKNIHKRGDMGSGGLKQDWAQYWPGIILNVLGHGGSQDRLFSLLTSSSGPPSHRIFLNHLFFLSPNRGYLKNYCFVLGIWKTKWCTAVLVCMWLRGFRRPS